MPSKMSAYPLESSQQHNSSRFPNRLVNDPLSVIYNQGQWRMSKVSAMHNLQYSAVTLKQYTSKIKQIIVSTIATGGATKYMVKVEGDPLLKYSEDDADALMITVSTTQSEASTKPKVAYEGILLSWGVSNTVPNAVHLPYMLERGEQKIGTAVKSALGTMFDCKVKQFSFTLPHLLQFGFNFVETERSNHDKTVAFTYTYPHTENKDKMTLNFEIGDIYLIWNGLKEETSKSELVHLTYQMLQNQIFHMFVLDITTLDLCEISLPKASIKNNGTVKMKTPEMVNCVFTVLNDINSIDAV